MTSLSGPHPISAQYQVKIPTKLARELHLRKGDQFFWRRSDDDPAVLVLIPAEVVERRYFAGEQIEASIRPQGQAVESAPLDRPTADGDSDVTEPPSSS